MPKPATAMKRKSAYRKKTSRKSLKNKYKRNTGKIANLIGGAGPFPLVLKTQFKYGEKMLMQQTAADTPVTVVFRANGAYDPWYASGGHQPRYWDTLVGSDNSDAPYYSYRVTGCKIDLIIWPTASSGTEQNGVVSIVPRFLNANSPASINEMMERPLAKYAYVPTIASSKPITLSHYVDIAKFAGLVDLADNSDYDAIYNGVPNFEVVFDVSMCAVYTGNMVCTMMAKLTYYTTLFNLNDVNDS